MGSKLGYGNWSSVAFRHPSTFKTLALDPSLKHKIKHDLDCFLQSREFYRKTGRAWKRGYLLYGPPGTGKSSLIAAIANYMNYDVYDLEITRVLDNPNLRQLLLATSSKSVIVIEDIDCSMSRCPSESHKDESKGARQATSAITLSGLLNFADGLWSSCGEERIMIFTTNHKDRLDPALLRSGRMDMHIHLCYCEFEAFKQLVFNYLDLGDHSLFPSVEEKMKSGGRLTPADICEIFVQNKYNPDAAIKALIDALDSGIPSGNENVIESREDEDEGESLSSHIQRNKYIRGIYQRDVEEELCGLSA
ncbi:AAA-ATPase At4g30250 [Cryptomeria japonica]|uniref:AAA-ATPase At4g30250 n=1 Tax=Cryptomeria japonica TaxID=3369 RepID=UPI0027DA37DC|nr:AAA-ATPase At4g30250 [Cryptomeria japonica]